MAEPWPNWKKRFDSLYMTIICAIYILLGKAQATIFAIISETKTIAPVAQRLRT